MKSLAPIAIFVYARPKHTKKLMESLIENSLAKESPIYVFCDNAKKEKDIENVNKVREYMHEIESKNIFKEMHIVEAEKNMGLANSVISGVTKVINEYKRIIVLEDDLVLANNCIEYMNEALDFYEEDRRIWSISGYNLPIEIPKDYNEDVYLSYRGCSWGWATWYDRWNMVDWEVKDYKEFKRSLSKRKKLNRGGSDMAQMLDLQMEKKIDSWAIRWCYEQSKRDMLTIYPTESLIKNYGLDGTGTHSGNTNEFAVSVSNKKRNLTKDIQLNKKMIKLFKDRFKIGLKGRIKEILIICRLEGVIDFAKRRSRNKV